MKFEMLGSFRPVKFSAQFEAKIFKNVSTSSIDFSKKNQRTAFLNLIFHIESTDNSLFFREEHLFLGVAEFNQRCRILWNGIYR